MNTIILISMILANFMIVQGQYCDTRSEADYCSSTKKCCDYYGYCTSYSSSCYVYGYTSCYYKTNYQGCDNCVESYYGNYCSSSYSNNTYNESVRVANIINVVFWSIYLTIFVFCFLVGLYKNIQTKRLIEEIQAKK